MSSGWPERYPILQPPNAPMLVAWGFRLAARVADGRTRAVAEAGYQVAIAVWAYGELASGANAVRRGFGAVALGMAGARLGKLMARWSASRAPAARCAAPSP